MFSFLHLSFRSKNRLKMLEGIFEIMHFNYQRMGLELPSFQFSIKALRGRIILASFYIFGST